ncbi:MAG: 4Fe-4S dicluster domain-containing protein, partial [Chloroflexota bacterium]|nr:4Fe-4S dicluster domain-containing protein [Chloroflexota bacterium]
MKQRDRRSTRLSRREFMKVAGTLLGGAVAYSVLAESGKPLLQGLLAQVAQAADGREHYWVFVVDVDKCIGCGKCVLACKQENNVPMHPECNRTWVERYRIRGDGEMLVDSPNAGIAGFVGPLEAPGGEKSGSGSEEEGASGGYQGNDDDREIVRGFFVPKLCLQCNKPPCVQVCPVAATYKTKDGVILIDQERCIGCGYCIQACPYGARYFLPDVRTTPMGQVRVVDKCTWCYHRITKGRLPACVEVCPVGARIFG